MNYIYLTLVVVIMFLLMFLFYKFGKKEGLFLYISFMSILLGLLMFKSIDILSFEIDLGVPFVIGIFICSNIIVQKYGIDEIKEIIKSFTIPCIIVFVILALVSLINSSEYNITAGEAFNELFGYNFESLRLLVGLLLSISFTLWCNANIYYYIRKSKNKYLISNIGSMLIIQFLESIIFVFVSYVGVFDINMMFGVIVIRYLLKVIIGIVGLLPFMAVLKIKS